MFWRSLLVQRTACRDIVISSGLIIPFGLASLLPAVAFDGLANLPIDNQRNIHNTFEMEVETGEGIPTNPMDLMERLRKAQYLDDATSPSEALDEALKVFNDSAGDINLVQ